MLLTPIMTKKAEGKASDNFHLPALSLICIWDELLGVGERGGVPEGINIWVATD